MTGLAFRVVFLGGLAIFTAGRVSAQSYVPPQLGGNGVPGQAPVPRQYPMQGQGPTNGPSILGAWSGDRVLSGMQVHVTDAYDASGRYVSVGQFSNGMLIRTWGNYRTNAIGANRLIIDFQVQGQLPQQMCFQAPGQAPNCQPLNPPGNPSSVVTFTSTDSFQAFDPQQPAFGTIDESRDPNPYLLQRQVPSQEVVMVQPPSQGAPAPTVAQPAPSYSPRYSAPATPRRSGCLNDDIQRSVCKYSGRLITSGGCLQCVN